MKKTVVLGVTSSIAAYKALDLIKLLRESNIDVFVIMTNQASKMIAPIEFEKTSGNKVEIELFEKDFDYKEVLKDRAVEHIALADKADVFVIAPATANIVAKLAQGAADDYLTTTALAVTSPIIICPSMNVNMWNNPAVQSNLEILKQRGYQVIEPDSGMLACGYEGVGRLSDIKKIKDEIIHALEYSSSLKGKKIIVTAGGTIERIDDVRYISNRSSGKMGAALAEELYLRGADVLLLRASNSIKPRYLIKEEIFSTAEDLLNRIGQSVRNYDTIFHAAAVSDFKVKEKINGKLSSEESVDIHLEPQIKILDQIKELNPKIKLVAFKAESLNGEELIKKARTKLEESNADAIIANDVSKDDRGFESDQNEVYIVTPDGKSELLKLAPKKEIARRIIDYLLN